MRIAVLADNLTSGGGLSVGRNIISTLQRVAPMHDYLFVIPRGVTHDIAHDTGTREILETHPGYANPRGAIESLARVPRVLDRFSPDLLWSLGNLPFRNPPCRQALLVQDPHLFYPERHYARESRFEKRKKRALAWYVARTLKSVELVFCQTATAAARFRRCYGFEDVVVMPNAVSQDIDRSDTALATPGRVAPYADRFRLFALTKYYAHKNLELILDAYDRYPSLMMNTVTFLTIAAEQHPGARVLLRRIAKEAPNQVINLGPLPQSELGRYFRAMDAVVQPTTLESFSATYLEAMVFRVPILTSDLDFSREICGKAASYFDPSSPLDLARKVHALRGSPALRAQLVASGTSQLSGTTSDWPTVVRTGLDALGVRHH